MAKVLFKNSAPVKKNNHLLLVTHPTPPKMFTKICRQHFNYAVDILWQNITSVANVTELGKGYHTYNDYDSSNKSGCSKHSFQLAEWSHQEKCTAYTATDAINILTASIWWLELAHVPHTVGPFLKHGSDIGHMSLLTLWMILSHTADSRKQKQTQNCGELFTFTTEA